MNWITNFAKAQTAGNSREKRSTGQFVETCPKCSQMLLKRELENNFFVCKHCDYHFRVSAKQRLSFFWVTILWSWIRLELKLIH